MKKTLVFTLVLTLLLSIATYVSAATTVNGGVTAPSTAKKGDVISVEVTFAPGVGSGDFYVEYNPDVLAYKDVSYPTGILYEAKHVSGNTVGGTFASSATAVDKITLTFEVTGDVNTSSDIKLYTVDSAFETMEGDDVTIAAGEAAKVTVVDEIPGSSVPESSDPEQSSTPESSEEKKDDNTGKKPTSMPQTGVNVAYVAGAVVLALAAGYVVSKKD